MPESAPKNIDSDRMTETTVELATVNKLKEDYKEAGITVVSQRAIEMHAKDILRIRELEEEVNRLRSFSSQQNPNISITNRNKDSSPTVVEEATGVHLQNIEEFKASDDPEDKRWRSLGEELTLYVQEGILTYEQALQIAVVKGRDAEKNGLQDALTEMHNRKGLDQELTRMMNHAFRSGEKAAVLFLDLDGFKDVNDTLGHKTGDEILRAVSKYIKGKIRKSDFAARYGGDEFAIGLLGDVDVLAEKFKELRDTEFPSFIRDELAQKNIHLKGKHISYSIGTTQLITDDTPESVLKRSDIAMYEDKRARHAGR